MRELVVAPIVEGHGEQESVRVLLTRIAYELVDNAHVEVLAPIRVPRSSMVRPAPSGAIAVHAEGVKRAVELAARKLAALKDASEPSLVLIIIDADDDCPRDVGPALHREALNIRPDLDTAVVVANVEYETWFVAAAESLVDLLDLDPSPPDDPESARVGKRWIRAHLRLGVYSESVDQPRLTARMSLTDCRRRAKSFDRLCRIIESRLAPRR